MPLASRHQQHERFATSVRAHIEFGAESAAAATQRFTRLPTPGPGGVLMGTHDRAVEEVHRPVHLPLAICPPL
jgi:hypothetical protein